MENRKHALLTFAAILIVFAAVFDIAGQVAIMILALLEVTLALFMNEYDLNPAIELVTLPTVITAYMFGITVAFWFGTIMTLIHYILSCSICHDVLYIAPSMGIAGIAADTAFSMGWLNGDISSIGIMASVIYNVITSLIGSVTTGDVIEEIFWSIINLSINAVIFVKIAPLILQFV